MTCSDAASQEVTMQDDRKMEVALFRLGVIAPLVYGQFERRGQKKKLLSSLTSQEFRMPHSGRSRLSKSTIWKWVYMYERGDRSIESLFPKDRSDKGTPRALSAKETSDLLDYLKRNPTEYGYRAYSALFEEGIISSRLSQASLSRILIAEGMTRKDRLKRLKAERTIHVPGNEYDWGMWMLGVLQGKVDRNDLAKKLGGTLSELDIDFLVACVKQKPLIYRNRALAIIATLSGIPAVTVARFLHMSRSPKAESAESGRIGARSEEEIRERGIH
jgi:hypothetical protein